jgi:hypothetical protein
MQVQVPLQVCSTMVLVVLQYHHCFLSTGSVLLGRLLSAPSMENGEYY